MGEAHAPVRGVEPVQTFRRCKEIVCEPLGQRPREHPNALRKRPGLRAEVEPGNLKG